MPDPCSCVKTETNKVMSPPQQSHKRSTVFLDTLYKALREKKDCDVCRNAKSCIIHHNQKSEAHFKNGKPYDLFFIKISK